VAAQGNNRGGRRRSIPAAERLKVWVRSGGRCVICNRYLLEGSLSYRELTFGELAHIVGQQAAAGSPRGLDDDLDAVERDTADNLVLVCDDEHDELDKIGSRNLFTVDFIRELKRCHEERIRHVTEFGEDRRTTILRMVGRLRGNAIEVGRDAATGTVIRCGQRFPRFSLAHDRHSIEVDLRHVAGEATAAAPYYEAAKASIDEVLDHKLADGVARDEITHLSVFAFARLPLLVHLGAQLDDNVPTDVYQRHRATESWEWPDPDAEALFRVDLLEVTSGHAEGVLVVNVTGSIQPGEVPAGLAELPRFGISIDGVTPSPDVIAGPKALGSFEASCRALLAGIEASHKRLRRLHVLAAIPVSAAVVLGRVGDPAVHPSLLVYDRTDDGYKPALEVGAR
jgi:hypothetical protein